MNSLFIFIYIFYLVTSQSKTFFISISKSSLYYGVYRSYFIYNILYYIDDKKVVLNVLDVLVPAEQVLVPVEQHVPSVSDQTAAISQSEQINTKSPQQPTKTKTEAASADPVAEKKRVISAVSSAAPTKSSFPPNAAAATNTSTSVISTCDPAFPSDLDPVERKPGTKPSNVHSVESSGILSSSSSNTHETITTVTYSTSSVVSNAGISSSLIFVPPPAASITSTVDSGISTKQTKKESIQKAGTRKRQLGRI